MGYTRKDELTKKVYSADARVYEIDFLAAYFDAFVDVASHLRIKMTDFRLDQLGSILQNFISAENPRIG
jgi:hypothetical protein